MNFLHGIYYCLKNFFVHYFCSPLDFLSWGSWQQYNETDEISFHKRERRCLKENKTDVDPSYCNGAHQQVASKMLPQIFNESQPAFTCSKLTLETLEQSVKIIKVNNKDTRTTPMAIVSFQHILHLVLVFPLLTLNM